MREELAALIIDLRAAVSLGRALTNSEVDEIERALAAKINEGGDKPHVDPLVCAEPVALGEWIGEVRENGVNWHRRNPHAHPVGTRFYAVAPNLSDSVEVPRDNNKGEVNGKPS